jgi:hypothetical protein
MRIFVLFLLAVAPLFSFSQGQTHNWYFGEGVGMDFSDGEPLGFDGGEVFGNPQGMMEYIYSEGVAVISDDIGNLLFYSNGEKVWDMNHEVMPNGDDLMGMYSSTTAAFIVPQPNSDSLFYLFTTDGLERELANGLRYSKIGMCRNQGKGDVIPQEKNILLLDTVSEKLAATYHANGTDVWLVSHKYFSDAFYAFRIAEDGIVETVISHTGSVHIGDPVFFNGCGGAIGQMKISSDGSRLALVFSNVSPAKAELFDFDISTGIVSNFIGLQPYGEEEVNTFMYGVEFSPDNSRLYLNGTELKNDCLI